MKAFVQANINAFKKTGRNQHGSVLNLISIYYNTYFPVTGHLVKQASVYRKYSGKAFYGLTLNSKI